MKLRRHVRALPLLLASPVHAQTPDTAATFVESMKAFGLVAGALAASGQKAAEVAPPAR